MTAARDMGLALTCTADGAILQVIRDDLGVTNDTGPGGLLTALAFPGSAAKVRAFLDAVASERVVLDWELTLSVHGAPTPLHIVGGRGHDGIMLIAAAPTRAGVGRLCAALHHLDGAAASTVAALLAAYGSQTPRHEDRDSAMYDELSRLNNELVTAQRDLAKSNAELDGRVRSRTEALETALQELETFSYSVAHELRAPLRAMAGFSCILAEDYGPRLDAEATRYLTIIRQSAVQMGEVIDALLVFSQLRQQLIFKEPVDMNGLVRECMEMLEPVRATQDVQLVCGDLPPCVGDRGLLKQVWTGLLGNALKYARDRHPARIEVGAAAVRDGAAYFVRDNGVGFDMANAHRLFQPFRRLHALRGIEGTGMGLATAARIITRHGGRIWAESAVGEGASFFFTLSGSAQNE